MKVDEKKTTNMLFNFTNDCQFTTELSLKLQVAGLKNSQSELNLSNLSPKPKTSQQLDIKCILL